MESKAFINFSWSMEKQFVTRHEKIGLMCTKYTALHYSTYLTFCVSYVFSVNCIKFSSGYWIIFKSFMDKLCSGTKLLNLELPKSGQILCAHKPYFLMPGHICQNYLLVKIMLYSNNSIHIRT